MENDLATLQVGFLLLPEAAKTGGAVHFSRDSVPSEVAGSPSPHLGSRGDSGVFVCARLSVYMCTPVCAYVYTHACLCRADVSTYMPVSGTVCMCACSRLCVCVCVFMSEHVC